jgi:hypothetical protein
MSPLSTKQMRNLQRFWPTSEGVDAIPLDAAAFDQNLFLALHQPMVFSRRNQGEMEATQETEGQLLETFLKDQGSGVTISVLEGQSGVGKSHAIRWLEARISDDSKYVVIWVPRNRSAKWVLTEILRRPEFNGEQFSEIRNRLTAAVEPIGVVEAGWSLRVKLALALQQEPRPGLSPLEREFFISFARELAEFVSDHNIWRLPRPDAEADVDASSNPLLRLARHLVGENLETRGIEDRLFVETDLALDPPAVGRAGPAAREFWTDVIRPNILLEDGETPVRRAIVGLLNRLLDEARAGVLGLDVTPIADLFVDLRRMLAEERKELILLIEDFTVMAGLQRSLLDIMVTTATTAGGDRICPIRTALALTPGYMHGEALPTNVRTRANMYIVEDRIEEEDALRRYEALTGSFLNAARLTPVRLDELGPNATFDEVGQSVDEESKAVLTDFGRSIGSNHWLFPFNREAVRALARQRVLEDNQLIYNPRIFMRNVLVPVLQHRSEFVAGDFPNGALGLPDRLAPVVHEELTPRVLPGTQGKYRRVLATWGGRIRDWQDACRVPSGIFDAFGLAPLEGVAPAPADSPPAEPTPSDPPPAPAGDLPRYHDRLEAWQAGEVELDQDVARDLRKSVADLVNANLPRGWPGLPRYAADSLFGLVFVPRARGNRQLTQETAFVNFSTTKDLSDPNHAARHHLQAAALLRWADLPDKSPSPDLFEVVSRASAFARRVKDAAARWLYERPADLKVKRSPEAVQAWITAQLTLAEAEGEACPRDPGKRLQRLFPDEPTIPAAAPPEWQELLGTLSEVSGPGNAGTARSGLLAGFAAFQGTSKTPYAIDAAALWDALRAVSLPMPQPDVMRAGLGTDGMTFVTNERKVIRLARGRLQDDCRTLAAWMGAHTPGTITKALGVLAHVARNSNVGRIEAEALLNGLNEFDGVPARTTGKLIQSIAEGIEDSKVISTLGKLDWNSYRQLEEIRHLSESLMDAVESSRQFQAATGASMDHAHIGNQFRAMLDSMNDILEHVGA